MTRLNVVSSSHRTKNTLRNSRITPCVSGLPRRCSRYLREMVARQLRGGAVTCRKLLIRASYGYITRFKYVRPANRVESGDVALRTHAGEDNPEIRRFFTIERCIPNEWLLTVHSSVIYSLRHTLSER